MPPSISDKMTFSAHMCLERNNTLIAMEAMSTQSESTCLFLWVTKHIFFSFPPYGFALVVYKYIKYDGI